MTFILDSTGITSHGNRPSVSTGSERIIYQGVVMVIIVCSELQDCSSVLPSAFGTVRAPVLGAQPVLPPQELFLARRRNTEADLPPLSPWFPTPRCQSGASTRPPAGKLSSYAEAPTVHAVENRWGTGQDATAHAQCVPALEARARPGMDGSPGSVFR